METNPQPKSDENKVRERLQECLQYARELDQATRAPAELPRIERIATRGGRPA